VFGANWRPVVLDFAGLHVGEHMTIPTSPWVRLLVVLLLAAAPDLAARRPSVTPVDIELATGLHGVHLVPPTTIGAVPGRDNYADGRGTIVLWFQDMNAVGFGRAKTQPAKTMNGIEIEPKLFHTAVAGLGDEAFDSPDGKLQHAIYVRKGLDAFALIANITASPRGDRPAFTMDQLKVLAMAVLSRM
jgi:hypothetical protein